MPPEHVHRCRDSSPSRRADARRSTLNDTSSRWRFDRASAPSITHVIQTCPEPSRRSPDLGRGLSAVTALPEARSYRATAASPERRTPPHTGRGICCSTGPRFRRLDSIRYPVFRSPTEGTGFFPKSALRPAKCFSDQFIEGRAGTLRVLARIIHGECGLRASCRDRAARDSGARRSRAPA